jgi:release factor glutamine methyltransferase
MSSQTKRVYFGDYVFLVDENVYEPAGDSFLFAENLGVEGNEYVLDMGTGCGILGILAAKKASAVLGVDLNPYAVSCAISNAKLNHVRNKMEFVQGDLFDSIGKNSVFDLILFNAPYVPTDDKEFDSWLSRSWAGGPDGRKVLDRFILEAPHHLKENGRLFLMQSTLAGVEETTRQFSENSLYVNVVSEYHLPFFETIILLEARF